MLWSKTALAVLKATAEAIALQIVGRVSDSVTRRKLLIFSKLKATAEAVAFQFFSHLVLC